MANTVFTQASDIELMAAIAQGEEAALEQLYERYARPAYALAFHLMREAPAAEDIVQEAFLSAWRKASTYQAQYGSVYNWLLAIIHHRAIDRLRSSTNRDQLCSPLEPGADYQLVCAEPEPYDQVWSGEQRRQILKVLEQIPQEQRQVIELAYFGGYTHVEIAELLHIPLGTVKGRMRLGLSKLKLLLEEAGIRGE